MTSPAALRWLCIAEGASFLVLLAASIANRLLADKPLRHAVRILGSAHGALFVLLLVTLALVMWRRRWSWRRGGAVLIASVLPFGFLAIDQRLRAWATEPSATPAC